MNTQLVEQYCAIAPTPRPDTPHGDLLRALQDFYGKDLVHWWQVMVPPSILTYWVYDLPYQDDPLIVRCGDGSLMKGSYNLVSKRLKIARPQFGFVFEADELIGCLEAVMEAGHNPCRTQIGQDGTVYIVVSRLTEVEEATDGL